MVRIFWKEKNQLSCIHAECQPISNNTFTGWYSSLDRNEISFVSSKEYILRRILSWVLLPPVVNGMSNALRNQSHLRCVVRCRWWTLVLISIMWLWCYMKISIPSTCLGLLRNVISVQLVSLNTKETCLMHHLNPTLMRAGIMKTVRYPNNSSYYSSTFETFP